MREPAGHRILDQLARKGITPSACESISVGKGMIIRPRHRSPPHVKLNCRANTTHLLRFCPVCSLREGQQDNKCSLDEHPFIAASARRREYPSLPCRTSVPGRARALQPGVAICQPTPGLTADLKKLAWHRRFPGMPGFSPPLP